MRNVLLMLYDGVKGLDVVGPVEVFSSANDVLAEHGKAPAYAITTGSLGAAAVRTSARMRLAPDIDLDGAPVADTLVAPGGCVPGELDLSLVAWLRANGARARRLVSVCTGAFVLAEAGFLAGRRATTHWQYCADLAELHPDVTVDAEPIFVRDGNIATSAGVTAGIDLALALVEDDLGRDVALAVARHLVVFLRRPGNQAQFSAQMSAQVAHRAPLRDVQRWIAEHPEADLAVTALARRAGLSPRHFTRAFTQEVGVAPGRYVDQVRLEAARLRLEDTDDSVGRIARACGYGTPEAMRRAFLRGLSVGPAEYRRRFTSTVAGQET
ncbi:GlxA family transcriptional regulator [Actinokineospora terrae]|uniref:Transcriptional regulator, AraC family with amidase-like domain n=1 Tax=Actinokineospora terrae TaxID=155974 RepID=A0A1H9L4K6_9PSEU|nr:GlxA family transcriptional regulator [Actinokineospora terrae]SER06268.1 transcriptional regulator, AraC family with amidase-like domain [Actinokineospora terrae]